MHTITFYGNAGAQYRNNRKHDEHAFWTIFEYS